MGAADFRQDEAAIKANYINLHEETGESYDSMARRLEQNSGDPVTAAKVRALGGGKLDAAPKGRRAAGKQTAAHKPVTVTAADDGDGDDGSQDAGD